MIFVPWILWIFWTFPFDAFICSSFALGFLQCLFVLSLGISIAGAFCGRCVGMGTKLSDNWYGLRTLVTWGPDGLCSSCTLNKPSWLLGMFGCNAHRSMCFSFSSKPVPRVWKNKRNVLFWCSILSSFGLLPVCQSNFVGCWEGLPVSPNPPFLCRDCCCMYRFDQGVMKNAFHFHHFPGFVDIHPKASLRTCPRPLLTPSKL